jgi:membrane fusion protein (multidrug efflux system)
MDARVDVANTDGGVLAGGNKRLARAQTSVFERGNGEADVDVQKIIAANLGHRVADARPAAAARASPTIARASAPAATR